MGNCVTKTLIKTMKTASYFKFIWFILLINLPNFLVGQELRYFQNYYDNAEKLDEIEGVFLFDYVHERNTKDIYNHTNEDSKETKIKVLAIKKIGNTFHVYSLNEETNLFRKWDDITIQKINNLYLISMNDDDYYDFNPFAILNNSFTLLLKRRVEIGQLSSENVYKYTVKEKLYPLATVKSEIIKSGTCFLISSKGYLITNYHVIKDAKNIYINNLPGQSKKTRAILVNYDEELDVAILKINITNSNLPFAIKIKTTEVGTSVFTMGYPLTQSMGKEIKLSVGIINAKSGYKGDTKYYQISNPIQPGNSGGPLFDNQGNLIGLVTSKFSGGDNVGYALKSNLLLNYLESLDINLSLSQNNRIKDLPLQNKYKTIKKYVYLIEVD